MQNFKTLFFNKQASNKQNLTGVFDTSGRGNKINGAKIPIINLHILVQLEVTATLILHNIFIILANSFCLEQRGME